MSSYSPKLEPTTYCPTGGRASMNLPRPSMPARTLAARVARLAARTRWLARRAVADTIAERLPRGA